MTGDPFYLIFILVLLSAHVERFSVSRMRDFLFLIPFIAGPPLYQVVLDLFWRLLHGNDKLRFLPAARKPSDISVLEYCRLSMQCKQFYQDQLLQLQEVKLSTRISVKWAEVKAVALISILFNAM